MFILLVSYTDIINPHQKQHSSRFHGAWVSKHNTFRCSKPNCQAGFVSRSLLKNHEKIHDNVQTKCVFCPYTSVHMQEMIVHQRSHFNIRNYKCEVCHKSFLTKNLCNRHYMNVHSGETSKCPACDRKE